MSATEAPYIGIDELFARIKDHDWSISELSLLTIPAELARAGLVRAIGRRCDGAGIPCDRWEAIPDYEWADLCIESRRREKPHYSGDLYWRSSGRRAYVFVQLSEPDVMREWLDDIFARPSRQPFADVVIPPLCQLDGGPIPKLARPGQKRLQLGGRPPKIDWDLFWIEIVWRANTPDGLPEERAALHKQMMQFCADRWGEEAPGDSTVRDKLSKLFFRG
jgi:hypothetical protein